MSETYTYENLIAGSQRDIVQRPAEFDGGVVLSRGELCGRLSATGYWQEVAFAALANYSEIGVAVEAIDTTTGGRLKTTVYVEGEFNENHVIFDYGNTASTWRETLAGYGIYLRSSQNTSGY